MTSIEILPAEWSDFFDRFSRQHQDWLAAVTVNAEARTPPLPLKGIIYERSGTGSLRIEFAEGERRVTHSMAALEHVRLLEEAQGAHAGVEIETADGAVAQLRFRTPALPETVDGIA